MPQHQQRTMTERARVSEPYGVLLGENRPPFSRAASGILRFEQGLHVFEGEREPSGLLDQFGEIAGRGMRWTGPAPRIIGVNDTEGVLAILRRRPEQAPSRLMRDVAVVPDDEARQSVGVVVPEVSPIAGHLHHNGAIGADVEEPAGLGPMLGVVR